MPRDDIDLARAAATGDRTARENLVDSLYDRVRLTVGYLVARDRDAEDLVQASLIEILNSIATFRGDSSLPTWADRITVRTSLRLIRRRRRAETIVQLGAQPPATVGGNAMANGSTDTVKRRELRRCLARILGRIRPKVRAAMVLRYVHGHSVAEMALLLDVPVETIRDRLKRGRQKLRKSVAADPVLAEWVEV